MSWKKRLGKGGGESVAKSQLRGSEQTPLMPSPGASCSVPLVSCISNSVAVRLFGGACCCGDRAV